MTLANTTLGSIVLDHPACAPLLQELRIDFCCKGDLTLSAACGLRGLDAGEVVGQLERAIAAGEPRPAEDPREMSTPELVAHIVSRHHEFLRTALPFLGHLASKVARVHGEHNPKLVELEHVFVQLRDLLDEHLDTEEDVLFRLVSGPAPQGAEGALALAGAHREHQKVGAALHRLRELADDFVAPEWACTSYQTLLRELRTLEGDVLRHVHLENHVLFPRLAAA
ncbi:MAG: iron-sulfur cluster repair di-iron protein [Deltaproteobacteria bacterium]